MGSIAKVFIDTEFTDLSLISGMTPPKLISLGAAVLDDDQYFYAELSDTWRQSDCSEWVCGNVLPLLQGGSALTEVSKAGCNFQRWVESLNKPAFICGTSEYDIHFVMDLFSRAQIPSNLHSVSVVHFGDFPVSVRSRAEDAEARYFSLRGGQHHALCDALAFRESWREGRAGMFNDPVGKIYWSRTEIGSE